MSNIQLLAKGAIDTYLTQNPEISFFKLQYKKHTNFSLQSYIQDIDKINFDNKISINVTRNADLINNIFTYRNRK